MTLNRTYVEVVVLHKLDGTTVPLFVLIGMIKNKITKIISTSHHRNGLSCITHYYVEMNGKNHELYECEGKWWFYFNSY